MLFQRKAKQMTNTPLFMKTKTVGFDQISDFLDKISAGTGINTNYPPYNIERTGELSYNITVAVAGFTEEDLSIELEKDNLRIEGKIQIKEDERDKEYIHKGIGMRSFALKFALAPYVSVKDARLVNGLLTVFLEKEIPEEAKVKKIEIKR